MARALSPPLITVSEALELASAHLLRPMLRLAPGAAPPPRRKADMIIPKPTSSVMVRPSASSYTRRRSGTSPMASRCGRGTSESVASVSTRNSPSQLRSRFAMFRTVAVTCVAPMQMCSVQWRRAPSA